MQNVCANLRKMDMKLSTYLVTVVIWTTYCFPMCTLSSRIGSPHIAAGINLNFWPAGPIFRHLGAFFIRRTFKGNKLYSTIFREYLG